jgi:hypothetical protein
MDRYISEQVNYLLRRADVLTQEAERLASTPEDEYEVGTALVWERTYGDRTYTYGAVKYKDGGGACWATTTTRQNRVDWGTLYSYYLRHADPGSVAWSSELTHEEWS